MKQRDPTTITLGFQCVELLCSDFMPTIPKEHLPRALEVVSLFAQQDEILNVALTAVTMLWNVSDQIARCAGLFVVVGGVVGLTSNPPPLFRKPEGECGMTIYIYMYIYIYVYIIYVCSTTT